MILIQRKKLLVITALTVVTTMLSLSFKADDQQEPKKLKNIKVFPATATYREVDHAMDEFKVELGVKCNYCHAPSKTDPKKMDMVSDENPKKDISRDMMRMTDEMNKKYISMLPHADTDKVQMITCNTCHRGVAKPNAAIPTQPKWPAPPANGTPPPPQHDK